MTVTIDKTVLDCMTRHVISVHRDQELKHAIGLMDREHLSVLPVIDDFSRVCGILSTSDLIGTAYDLQCDISVLPVVSECVRKTLIDAMADDNSDRKVNEVMCSSVVAIHAHASIKNAAAKLIEHSVHHLPVIDNERKPIGIISTTDIVRAVATNKSCKKI